MLDILEVEKEYEKIKNDKNFIDQVMNITNNRGFDYAMDCSGNTYAHNAALNSLAKFGYQNKWNNINKKLISCFNEN